MGAKMNRTKCIKEINARLLNEYIKLHKKDEKLALAKELLRIARQAKLISYELWLKGHIQHLNKNYEEAMNLYESAKRKYSKLVFPWSGLGGIYLVKGNYNKAVEYYQKALLLKEDMPHIWNGLGNCYSKWNRNKEAIKYYDKAIKIDQNYSKPYNGKGIVYTKMGNIEDAKISYNSAVEYDHSFAHPWAGLSYLYMIEEDYDQAIECCDKAILLNKETTVFLDLKGTILSKKGSYNDAIKAFKTALELNSDIPNANVLKNIGLTYQSDKKFSEAINYFESAIEEYNTIGKNNIANMLKERVAILRLKIDEEDICKDREITDVFSSVALENMSIGKLVGPLENERIFSELIGEVNIRISKSDSLMEKYCSKRDISCTLPCNKLDIRSFNPALKLPDNYFLNLKGWSSNIPLIAASLNDPEMESTVLGGGYFIKWKNTGIVIDPGINFLKNFHKYNHHIYDINMVVVTHNHIDHMFDMKAIFDLQREYNKGKKTKVNKKR